ncbi:LuxR C-terminal-related transcriptional regulator [Streptomyces phaeochromogenes]|uniref:LuxR C-terminal-related transcriptional regulator n=1 Tax=Streptomyces phaeochromogenes TaxID=1923 RepID=UPI003F4D4354
MVAASALTEDDCPLTDRELEVLRAARTGASVVEIAAAVHLAPGTVRNYSPPPCPNWERPHAMPPRITRGKRVGSEPAASPPIASRSVTR